MATTRPVPVTYFPLKRKHLIPTSIFAVLAALSTSRAFVDPGSPLHDHVLARVAPSLSLATVHTMQDWVFRVLVLLHAAELPFFVALRLRKHGVRLASGLGLKWMAALFLGGMGTWDLFAETVKAEEAKRL